MLKNYLRTAWRNLRNNKFFSFINILGLSIGISASLVIYLVVSYDFSFDRSHQDGDRIYRVVTDNLNAGVLGYNDGVTFPLGDGMRKDLAGLDLVAPFYIWFPEKVSVPADPSTAFRNQEHIVFADENYFKIIEYQWLAGSPVTSLSGPYQVVLTESNAKLYFPGLSPEAMIGKRLDFSDTVGTVVTGVVKDLPYHTDFVFKAFISRTTLEKTNLVPIPLSVWGPTIGLSQLYVKLSRGVRTDQMESKIEALVKEHGINADPTGKNKFIYRLQPLSDLHFNPLYGNYNSMGEGCVQAHKPTLYGLLTVAAFLLLLACINFINLTTAQSSQRAKEIGIRKTIGSSRRQLIVQFLAETFLLTLLATLLSVLLTPLLLKVFADFVPKGLHFNIADQPGILLFGTLLLFAVSLLSGIYPAMVLSSYRPVMVLKNQGHLFGDGSRSAGLRKMLTVSQFVIAQVFVMSALLVSRQINYVLHKDLGFKKDAIVNFYTSFHDGSLNHRQVLMDKLRAIPGIALLSLSGDAPYSVNGWGETMKYKDGGKEVETEVNVKYADTNYCRLYHIKLLAGSELSYSDTVKSLLINETYLHLLGFQDPRDAIGKSVYWEGDEKIPIVGVVADFHQKSLHSPIGPLVITSNIKNEICINAALAPQDDGDHSPGTNSWKNVIASMAKAWSSVYPEDDFRVTFEDEEIAKAYKSEQDIAKLLAWATGLAVFISCLGLLGLVIYTTNQRTKEIGIRKILGASVTQLVSLLSADFLKLIGWAFLVAVPIAWWGVHAWLNNFAYRTGLRWWIFVAGGLFMGGMALVILLLRTFRAATANPVDSLRAE